MVNVLAIEVFAASTFAWAEQVLSDPEISDAPEEAANLVRYIRSDESPHVEYLRTGLSEISARTLLTLDGKEIPGKKIVDALMDRSLKMMMRNRAVDRPALIRDLIVNHAKGKDVESLLAEFNSMATPWEPPARYAPQPPPATSATSMRKSRSRNARSNRKVVHGSPRMPDEVVSREELRRQFREDSAKVRPSTIELMKELDPLSAEGLDDR